MDDPDSIEIRVGEKKRFEVCIELGDGENGLITGTPTVSLYDDTDTVVSGFDGVAASGWTQDSRPKPLIWYRIDNSTSPLAPGVYTLVFSEAVTVNGSAGDVREQRVLIESINSPHLPMAAKICRLRLQESDTQLVDGALLPEIDMMVRRVAQRFSSLNLTNLVGTDFQNFQDAIGILTAAKMRPGRAKRLPVGEISVIKTDLQEFRFDTRLGASGVQNVVPIEEEWKQEGATALRSVSVIKAYYANIATTISFSGAAGKRSKLEAEGVVRSSNDLWNELMKERLEPMPWGWSIWAE